MLNEISCSVLVFRTNIQEASELKKIEDALQHEPGIRRWNVDLEDIDHVLRVESEQLTPEDVVVLIRKAGFECEELPD